MVWMPSRRAGRTSKIVMMMMTMLTFARMDGHVLLACFASQEMLEVGRWAWLIPVVHVVLCSHFWIAATGLQLASQDQQEARYLHQTSGKSCKIKGF